MFGNRYYLYSGHLKNTEQKNKNQNVNKTKREKTNKGRWIVSNKITVFELSKNVLYIRETSYTFWDDFRLFLIPSTFSEYRTFRY